MRRLVGGATGSQRWDRVEFSLLGFRLILALKFIAELFYGSSEFFSKPAAQSGNFWLNLLAQRLYLLQELRNGFWQILNPNRSFSRFCLVFISPRQWC